MGIHWWCGKHLSHPLLLFFCILFEKTILLSLHFTHVFLTVRSAFTLVFLLGPDLCFTSIVCREFLPFHRFVCLYHFVTMTDNKNSLEETRRTQGKPGTKTKECVFSVNFFFYLLMRELLSTEEEEPKRSEVRIDSWMQCQMNKQMCRDGGDGNDDGGGGCIAVNF